MPLELPPALSAPDADRDRRQMFVLVDAAVVPYLFRPMGGAEWVRHLPETAELVRIEPDFSPLAGPTAYRFTFWSPEWTRIPSGVLVPQLHLTLRHKTPPASEV